MKFLKSCLCIVIAVAMLISLTVSASAASSLKLKASVKYYGGYTKVTISCNNDDYDVRYTTDGSVPTTKSKLYTKAIKLKKKATLRYAAFDDGNKVKVLKKTIKVYPTKPTIKYSNNKITFKSVSGKLYYTTDGTNPKTSATRLKISTDGSVSVKINKNRTVKACLYKNGLYSSVGTLKVDSIKNTSDSGSGTTVNFTFEGYDDEEKSFAELNEPDETYLAALEMAELVNKEREKNGLSL